MDSNKEHKNSIFPYNEWEIIEERLDKENILVNETIFSLGNGHIGFRGNFEEGTGGENIPCIEGTYINGFYETSPIIYPEIAYGYADESQTMLNVANSRIIRLFIEDEEFSMFRGELHEYERILSLREGTLTRKLVWKSPKGREVRIRVERLVSLTNRYLAAIRYEVVPLNFSGSIRLVSILNGDVKNQTVENDPRVGSPLKGRVLEICEKKSEGNLSGIVQKTRNSGLALACCQVNQLETEAAYSSGNISSGFVAGNEYHVKACL